MPRKIWNELGWILDELPNLPRAFREEIPAFYHDPGVRRTAKEAFRGLVNITFGHEPLRVIALLIQTVTDRDWSEYPVIGYAILASRFKEAVTDHLRTGSVLRASLDYLTDIALRTA